MARREYTAGRATTLASAFAIGATDFTIADDGSASTWPTSADYDFFVTIGAGTSNEERVLCSARNGRVITVAAGGRGKDSTGEKNHAAGETVWPSLSAEDVDEANAHINSTGYSSHSQTVHGLGSGDGVVVGTDKPQTLTAKTLTSPKINENVTLTATSTELNVLDGITASTAELNYTDGVTSSIQTQIDALLPKGMISPFAGSSAPTGWLLCNGAAVSRTTYSALFAVIGTTYGAGDTTTTFNVPDLLGRVPMGAGAGTDLTARTLGAELGVESVTLTAAQSGSPSHDHGVTSVGGGAHTASGSISTNGHGHTLTMAFSGDATHDHAIAGVTNPRPAMTSDGDNPGTITNSNGTAVADAGAIGGSASVSVADHSHTIDITVSTATAAAEAHTNIQPSTVVNFIIKF